MSTTRISSVCPGCGETFWYYRSQATRYCSNTCRKQTNGARIDTACPSCGKAFWYYKSWPRKYCSRVCASRATVTTNLSVKLLEPKYCEQCGELITKKTRQARDRFCSQKCFGVWSSANVVGSAHPSYKEKVECICRGCGKAFSTYPCWVEKGGGLYCSKVCRRTRVTKPCETCGNAYEVAANEAPTSRFCSRRCQGMQRTGESNPNWKGGSSVPYYGRNWVNQRRNARRRDNYTCQKCGVTEAELGVHLDVHHVIPFRKFGVDRYLEANRIANLLSVCKGCHASLEPRR